MVQSAVLSKPSIDELNARVKALQEELKQARTERKAQYTQKLGIGEFKGHRTYSMAMDNGRVFVIGQAKAKAIVANIKEINAFSKLPPLSVSKPKELDTEEITLE